MNLLLCKFSIINNFDLQNLINCYQNYFIFESTKDDTMLYLDTKILKKYLKNGLDIKHRKYIFLFLKDMIKDINCKYKLLNNISNIIIDDKIYNNLCNEDIKNLESIINLSNKIIKKYNKFTIKDKNVIKLSNNFYANIELNRFFFTKIKDKIFKFNGIILNYKNLIKNKILTLLSINYINKNKINNIKKTISLNTNCTLILTENNNEWENILNKYLSNTKYKIINSKKNFKNIFNKDILNIDFLIVNINIISSIYYKNYFKKYENIDNDIYISVINSIYDNMYNINIENELFDNLYIFQWNNIIYDNIKKIQNIDKNNFIYYLSCNHIKYYLLNGNLDYITLNYIIENSITDINNKTLKDNSLLDYDINNFYYFFKKELLIKSENDHIKIKYNFFDLELTDQEKNIYDKLFDNNDNYKNNDKSIFFLEYIKYIFNYNTIDEIIVKIKTYYDNLINKENEKTENINSYNLKLQYSKNILTNIDNNQYNCTICIDNINKNNICILNCGHYFCNDCIIKYINQKDENYECPICRDKFNINNIYCTYINNNNNINYGAKINKLIEIINDLSNKKIIIIMQYDKIINKIKEILNLNNIKNFNIFNKNKFLKEKNIKIFELFQEKSVLLCNYNDIIDYTFTNIDEIILLDYTLDNEKTIIKFKDKLFEDICNENNIININLLYIKDTFEEIFIDKYIK